MEAARIAPAWLSGAFTEKRHVRHFMKNGMENNLPAAGVGRNQRAGYTEGEVSSRWRRVW